MNKIIELVVMRCYFKYIEFLKIVVSLVIVFIMNSFLQLESLNGRKNGTLLKDKNQGLRIVKKGWLNEKRSENS